MNQSEEDAPAANMLTMRVHADSDGGGDGDHSDPDAIGNRQKGTIDSCHQHPTLRCATNKSLLRPAFGLFFCFAMQCCSFIMPLHMLPTCNALSSPMPSLNQIQRTSLPSRFISSPLLSHSLTSQEQPLTKNNAFPDTKPFNHDIAGTLFAPLFFTLRQHKRSEQSTSSIRHLYEGPSPFEDPSCAQTAERMLRRMMENRYRSDGRTVCPDGRTFGLVAGAFGRLRYGSYAKQRSTIVGGDGRKLVTWEEDPNINPQYRNDITEGNEVEQNIGKIQMAPTDKLQQLLQLQLQLCHHEGWPTEIRPTVEMYNRVLKRLAWQSGSFRPQNDDENEVVAAEQAWLWLQLMQSHLPQDQNSDEESTPLCRPNAMTYAYAIEALAAHRAPVDTESSEMTSLMGDSTMSAFEPIDTFAEKLDMEMIESSRPPTDLSPKWFLSEAEKLLVTLEDQYDKMTTGEVDIEHGMNEDELKRALAYGYRCLLEGWGRYAVAGISSESEDHSPPELLNHAIKRAHELLGRFEALAKSERDIVPSSCYSSVILALSISESRKTADIAEAVLNRMISQYSIDELSLQESYFSPKHAATAFSGVIAAHAKNNDAPKAEKILLQMIELYDNGRLGSEFVPEVRAFGTCVALWQKYSPGSGQTYKGKGSRGRNVRGQHDPPSLQQRIRNADRAEAILYELERVAKEEATKDSGNFVLHATPYNIAILARVQTIAGNDRKSPKMNKYDYDYIREENEEILLHAQEILDHMEYKMGVTPDPYTYSILLHAWCQQSRPGNENAADYAESLLRRRIEDVDIGKLYGDDVEMKNPVKTSQTDIWPNAKHYSSVLKAQANTKSAGGAKKALGLLSEMERRYYAADVLDDADNSDDEIADYHQDRKDAAKPDIVCYSIVIDAFANSRLPEASSVAHRLLRAVETKYDAGDVSMKPNTRIYTAVILSLVHSPLDGDDENNSDISSGKMNNPQRAWSILERMKSNDATPNSFTYNYIINCAAESGHDDEDKKIAFEIALRAFQELRKASPVEPDINGCVVDPCHPDSFTYAFMLKACKNLLPASSLCTKVMSQTFQECCRSGYLNDAVLDRLWQGVSTEKFLELVEEELPTYSSRHNGPRHKSPIHTSELPMSWSRCCNSVKRRSRI